MWSAAAAHNGSVYAEQQMCIESVINACLKLTITHLISIEEVNQLTSLVTKNGLQEHLQRIPSKQKSWHGAHNTSVQYSFKTHVALLSVSDTAVATSGEYVGTKLV